MPKNLLRLSVAALAVAASLSLSACGGNGDRSGAPAAPAAPSTSADSPTTSSPSTTSPSTTSLPNGAANDADVLFAQMMIPHQKQAIEMSELILAKHAIDPRVSELANTIKKERTAENNQMSDRLTLWGASATPSMDMRHDRVGNMVAKADVDKLKQATGTRSAALFLDDMIEHHQSAIGIAQAELDDGQDPAAKRAARQLVDNQQSEIKLMTRLRASI